MLLPFLLARLATDEDDHLEIGFSPGRIGGHYGPLTVGRFERGGVPMRQRARRASSGPLQPDRPHEHA